MGPQSDVQCIDTKHVDVLDGVRAAAILVIVWYHLWQQSWLMPIFETPALSGLGISYINLDNIPRTGYLFVDLLLLLSAFCLFLPYARAALLDEPYPSTRAFYKKRFVRIVPCYYLSALLIFFCYSLPAGVYWSAGSAWKDLFATLTFTQTFQMQTYLGTNINVVLWTAAVEMQFYLIFPLLAKAFTRRPLLTYLAMVGVSELYLRGFALQNEETLRMTLNQMVAFLGVFANGMGGAYLFVLLSKRVQRSGWLSAICSAAFLAGLVPLAAVMNGAARAPVTQAYQAAVRLPLSLLFLALIFALALSCRALRAVFSNRVARFIALISYNLYIWHQWIAVRLKEWRIPYWEGDNPPNMTGDLAWQWQYFLLSIGLAFGVAILVTYCFERPLSRRLLGRPARPLRSVNLTDTEEA